MRANVAWYLAIPALVLFSPNDARAQATGSVQVLSILTGGDVVPNQVLTGAFGLATLTIDFQSDSVTLELDVYNLPSGVSGAHIHVGAPGIDGPVLFDLRPPARQAGDFNVSANVNNASLTTHSELGVRDLDDALQSIIGLTTYIDVHTDTHPDGEIRGPLVIGMPDSTASGVRQVLNPTAR